MESTLPTTYNSQPAGDGYTQQQQQQGMGGAVRFDRRILFTRQCIIKLAQLACSLLGLIVAAFAAASFRSAPGFFNFVASVSVVVALLQVASITLHVRERLASLVPLDLIELVFAAVWCFFYFAASTACVVEGSEVVGQSALTGAGFFGYLAMVFYGVDTFSLFVAWKSAGGAAARQQQQQQQATTPTY